ncbi:hypothetical protein GOX01_22070 [Gluconobacter oxydans]|nr:hypothetical protein GOX01_22070 [Gluconobacter oxydans]
MRGHCYSGPVCIVRGAIFMQRIYMKIYRLIDVIERPKYTVFQHIGAVAMLPDKVLAVGNDNPRTICPLFK